MKEFWIKFKSNITLEGVVVKLILAWLLTSLIFAIKIDTPFMSAQFTGAINLGMYISFLLLFFVFFCAVSTVKNLLWVETYGPLILVTIYGTMSMYKNPQVSYLVGILLAIAIALAYAVNKTRVFAEIKSKKTVIIMYVAAALFYMAITGTTTVLRYINYYSPAFDFGIWAQMFQNMKTGFAPVTTVEREYLLSHFAVHFSPIYYVYLPFYMIFPYPVTLQVLQTITLASGIIPVLLICKNRGLSKTAQVGFGFIFALFPALATGCYYDLHENCFLVPLLLWLFYFIEKDSIKGMIIFSVLTVLVKEDAAVYLACIGIYTMFGKNKYVKGAVMTAFAIIYFLGVTFYLKKFGLGIMSNRYSNFMTEDGQGLIWVVRNFITNPAFALKECFKSDRFEFILYMLLPVGFMPVITKKVANLVLLIPMLIVNLAPDYQYQHSIFFQYVFGTLAILIYMSIINYADMSEKIRKFFCGLALCAAIVVMPLASLSKTWYWDNYSINKKNIQILDEVMRSIPEDKSVSASTFFVAHLYRHKELYEYPHLYKEQVDTDYVLVDVRSKDMTKEEQNALISKGYELISYKYKLYMLFQKRW